MTKHRNDLPDGNILNAPEQTIVIPINTVGVMGAGIAKLVKDKYPAIYKKYHKACKLDICTPNSLLTAQIGEGRQLLLFPTKIDWRNDAIPEMIHDNVELLMRKWRSLNITSLAVPQLGTGCGNISEFDRIIMEGLIAMDFEASEFNVVWYKDN